MGFRPIGLCGECVDAIVPEGERRERLLLIDTRDGRSGNADGMGGERVREPDRREVKRGKRLEASVVDGHYHHAVRVDGATSVSGRFGECGAGDDGSRHGIDFEYLAARGEEDEVSGHDGFGP